MLSFSVPGEFGSVLDLARLLAQKVTEAITAKGQSSKCQSTKVHLAEKTCRPRNPLVRISSIRVTMSKESLIPGKPKSVRNPR